MSYIVSDSSHLLGDKYTKTFLKKDICIFHHKLSEMQIVRHAH